MSRRLIILVILMAALLGAGFSTYSMYFKGEPPPDDLKVPDDPTKPLSPAEEFEKFARENPVAMLGQCIARYNREVKGGVRFTLEKQERVKGEPKPPEMPPVEVIDVCVRGDVPDAATHKTAIEVAMKWKSGAKVYAFAEIRGTLFSEKPESEKGLDGKVITWRPDARAFKLSFPVPANNDLAKGQSRYCIRDAGLFRSMLRTHEAWKIHQDAGELKFEYLGKKTLPQIGRECHVIKRTCPSVEIDSFEVGRPVNPDPNVVATEGFNEVTIYIDTERWLQVGTELYRIEPDGTRVLIGAYYMRDVQLNPSFPPDTFTAEGLKK